MVGFEGPEEATREEAEAAWSIMSEHGFDLGPEPGFGKRIAEFVIDGAWISSGNP